MPLYDIRNKSTEEVKEVMMSYDSLQQYLSLNPDWEQIITVNGKIYEGSDIRHQFTKKGPPQQFKELLSGIKKSHRGSTINDW